MKKVMYSLFGLLGAAYAGAQLLQAAGVFGVKGFSFAGISAIALGLLVAVVCFKKAGAAQPQ